MKDDSQIIRQSPGYLLEEIGLEEVFVYRPHGSLERSGLRRASELDADIRNRGPAYLFRMTEGDPKSIIFSEDGLRRYICVWIAFDYTNGNFFLTFRSEEDDLVSTWDVSEVRLRRFSVL